MAKKLKDGGRFSLAINPDTLWAIKRLAEYEGISANQYIANLLDVVAAKHADILKEVKLADEAAKKKIKFVSADAAQVEEIFVDVATDESVDENFSAGLLDRKS